MEDNQQAGTCPDNTQDKARGSIPASAVINFATLFILFTAILALQHYGRELKPSAGKMVETPVAVVEEVPPQVVEPAPVVAPAPVEASAPVEAPEPVVMVTETAKTVTDISEIELPTPPKPKAVLPRAKITKFKTAEHWNPAMENEVSVELLDNEGARQTYLAANRGIPAPKENPLPIQNTRDFIPFEKK